MKRALRGEQIDNCAMSVCDLTEESEKLNSTETSCAPPRYRTRSVRRKLNVDTSADIQYLGLCINSEDMRTLNNGCLLNDSIIDFYSLWIQQQMSPETRERVHIFSSFMYQKLLYSSKEDGASLSRWNRGADIFSKDFLFFPVCEKAHW
jgi:Ulp1 family protease